MTSASKDRFRVRVTKDHLVFSAAHFITFAGGICERLHGHNWRVAAEVWGPLDQNQYVYDFIALRDGLQKIVDRLDHRMLLPLSHPTIKVVTSEHEVEVKFEDRRWVFPLEECVILPVINTTAEEIARWMLDEWLQEQPAELVSQLASVQVDVEENFGQWASCFRDLNG
ncbi:6-pyruvoyl trahydropterin synthase family protein [Lacunimicrobium album]